MDEVRYVLDFQWAHGLSTGTARACFLAFFALVTLFGLSFRRAYVFRGAADGALWRDLRIWVLVIMALQAGLYLAF